MDVVLKNVGVVKSARIRLDGLAVITGYNDSGKSTVGKALYSFYHGLAGYEQKFEMDFLQGLWSEFQAGSRNLGLPDYGMPFMEGLQDEDYMFSIEGVTGHRQAILGRIREYWLSCVGEVHGRCADIDENVKRLGEYIDNATSPDFHMSVLHRRINASFKYEFGGQLSNSYLPNAESSMWLLEGDLAYELSFLQHEVAAITGKPHQSLVYDDAVYIESPLALSEATELIAPRYHRFLYNSHLKDISEKLTDQAPHRDNIVTDTLEESSNRRVDEMIAKVFKGKLTQKERRLQYSVDGHSFSVGSIANGLKAYGLLRQLMDNGYLTDRTLLIIDEPEVHLHPDWQMKFAETLVLLASERHVPMLLTTHSPFFLQALDLYGDTCGFKQNIHYYLAEREADGAVIRNVDGNLDAIYQLLVMPLARMKEMMLAGREQV